MHTNTLSLKDYFQNHEITAFGPFLSRLKAKFTDDELNISYYNIVYKNGDNSDFNYSITSVIKDFTKKSDQAFKDFVLHPDKEIAYDNCRFLKKVINIDKLIEKFVKDDQYQDIKSSTKSLLNSIDEKGHIYYAVANNLEGSNLEQFHKEIIGHIFHYVDGDISL